MKKTVWICVLIMIVFSFGCSNNFSKNDILQSGNLIESNSSQANEITEVYIKELSTTFTANIMLLSDGRVFSWGENQSGVLGLGDDTQNRIYDPIQVKINEPISHIVTSSQGNTVIAIADSGNIYGWGANNYHLISSENVAFFSSPVLINFDIPVSQIRISPLLGTISDEYGNLYGFGWTTQGPSVHFEASESLLSSSFSLSEILLNDDDNIIQFENSTLYRCFLNDKGNVFLQGSFVEEKVIYDGATLVPFPEKIIKIGPMYQGLVALSDSGKLYFIGEDRFGIYGNDSSEYYPIYNEPVIVEKFNRPVKDLFVSSSSIIVMDESGDIYTWGYNLSKNNAESTNEIINVPNKLDYNGTIKKCFCGEFSNVIIDEDNEVYVWGSNYQNLFLNKNQESTYSPQKLSSSVFIDEDK